MSNFVVGDTLAGKYEIKAVLGSGGMGTVYRARQIDLGRDVAIKVPNPQALEVPGFLTRFSREARLVAKLVHDNVVQVYEYQESQTNVYIVMEYVEGQDLKALIMNPPADLTVRDLAVILRGACEGLAHAHEFGIVHRDIKPHNIMVEQRARGKWRVKIMDFGIAHMDANANLTMMNQEQLTVTGQAIGTPSYMSPEQIRGSGVSPKSDIYSMGCVIFYAFTRTTPFQGTGFTVAASHLSDAPPAIRSRAPNLPPEVEDVVYKCLEKDPDARPIDASDLGQELFEALKPIFDTKMLDIWPTPGSAGGGTDVLKQTKPLDPSLASAATVMEGAVTETTPSGGKKIKVADSDRIPGVSPHSRTATLPQKIAPREQTRHHTQTSATGQTVPYQQPPAIDGDAAGAVGDAGDAPSAVVPKKNVAFIAAAVLIPLLLIGVIGGIYFKDKLGGKSGEDTSNGGQSGTDPQPTLVVNVQPTPTAGPDKTSAPPKPTPTVTPSPRPSPSIDPAVARMEALKSNFSKTNGLSERAQLWQQAAGDDDPRLADVAKEFALETARNPELRAIPAGTFTMGSPPNEGESEERPQYNVNLSAYEIGKYEVTALEFCAFLNEVGKAEADKLMRAADRTNISYDDTRKLFEPKQGRFLHPANSVTWEGASRYAEWLSQKTGERYRLPTEAEWENAARAGSSFRFPWGDSDPVPRQAQYNASGEGTVAVVEMSNGRNSWGLSHMSGNVAEWCSDWYLERAYDEGDRDNPKGPINPPSSDRRPRKVVRGGSFQSLYSTDIRNARRDRVEPDKASPDLGFRIVREVK